MCLPLEIIIYSKIYTLGMSASQLLQAVPAWLGHRRIPQDQSQEQTCAYACKRGYLGDVTNQGGEGSSGGDGVEGTSDSDQGGGKNDHSDIDDNDNNNDNKSASNNEFEGRSASNKNKNKNNEGDDIYQDE